MNRFSKGKNPQIEHNLPNNMIYILRAGESHKVKIGFSKSNSSLQERIKTLQSCSPQPLKLEGKMRGSKLKERYLHHLCIKRHLHHEWFSLTGEEVSRLIKKYKHFSPTIYHGKTFSLTEISIASKRLQSKKTFKTIPRSTAIFPNKRESPRSNDIFPNK